MTSKIKKNADFDKRKINYNKAKLEYFRRRDNSKFYIHKNFSTQKRDLKIENILGQECFCIEKLSNLHFDTIF